MIVDDIDVGKVKDYLMDVKEYVIVGWMEMYGKVVEFMEKYERKPCHYSENREEKKLGIWIRTQQRNYKDKKGNVYIIKEYKNKWNEINIKYYELLKSKKDTWNDNYNIVIEFIKINKRRPQRRSKNNIEKKIGAWFEKQQTNYINNIKCMKDNKRKQLWKELIEKYNEYFRTDDEIWNDNYIKTIKFIIENNSRPKRNIKVDTKESTLGKWIDRQQSLYNTNNMKDSEKQKKWKDLIEKYHIYFRTDDEIWVDTYNEAIKFIIENNHIPSPIIGIEDEKRIGIWINRQQSLYNTKNKCMKDSEKRKKWKYFIDNYLIDKYRVCPKIDNETWNNNYNEAIKFIIANNKIPSRNTGTEKEQYLGKWISNQQSLYNSKTMNNHDRIEKWEYFIDNYLNNNKNKTIECIPKKKN
jgi:hypothetical protein